MNDIQNRLRSFLIEKGASDVGFFSCDEGPLPFGVTIVVRLSNAIVSEITDEPTHTYFNHYRSVNAFIDSLLLQAGLFLQREGYDYITVAASQSINKDGWNYRGRFSHKMGARLSGLGSIGKNSLFIHKDYGSAVRLGTLFTSCEFDVSHNIIEDDICKNCDLCVKACPAGAIKGKQFCESSCREDMFDPKLCSEYMKNKFRHIGRGAVCGICMKACPLNNSK